MEWRTFSPRTAMKSLTLYNKCEKQNNVSHYVHILEIGKVSDDFWFKLLRSFKMS